MTIEIRVRGGSLFHPTLSGSDAKSRRNSGSSNYVKHMSVRCIVNGIDPLWTFSYTHVIDPILAVLLDFLLLSLKHRD